MDDPNEQKDRTDVEMTPEAKVVEDKVRDELDSNTPLTWTAAEFIHLDKGAWWFVIFGVVVVALIALDVFLLKSWTFSILVVVMAVATVIYVRRPPREISYSLSVSKGLYVADKLHGYDEFKSFGIVRDGSHMSIFLMPVKRFSPGVSVYFPEELGDDIADILGKNLPMQNIRLDILDQLIRQLRL